MINNFLHHIVAPVLVFCSCAGQNAKELPNTGPLLVDSTRVINRFQIHGTWEIVGYQLGFISAMGDEEARIYLGRKVVLSDSAAIFDFDDFIVRPLYKFSVVNTEEHFRQSKTGPENLGISTDSLTVIRILDGSLVRKTLFQSDAGLIYPWNGCFFFLKKK